jgi:hypothetical protein
LSLTVPFPFTPLTPKEEVEQLMIEGVDFASRL